MSSVRAERKARQAAKIQPKAVWIEGVLYDIDKIPQELIDKGYVFKIEEVVPNGNLKE